MVNFSVSISIFVYFADHTETDVTVPSNEDRILTEQLHLCKGYDAKKNF